MAGHLSEHIDIDFDNQIVNVIMELKAMIRLFSFVNSEFE